jgi:KipI family sensor histidine kinase inhibitor
MIDIGPLGDRAFLVRCDDEDHAARWVSILREQDWADKVVDIVLAYRSVALFVRPGSVILEAFEGWLSALDPALHFRVLNVRHEERPPSPPIAIPVLYDGEDLPEVAGRLGLTADEVVGLHSGRDYQVLAIGFLPGFPYAGYLPEPLAGLPRRDSPRVRVPAGSVAITGNQTGIYPSESPGGWHLIGRTPLRIVDLESGHFPIRAGDRILFEPIGRPEFEARAGELL